MLLDLFTYKNADEYSRNLTKEVYPEKAPSIKMNISRFQKAIKIAHLSGEVHALKNAIEQLYQQPVSVENDLAILRLELRLEVALDTLSKNLDATTMMRAAMENRRDYGQVSFEVDIQSKRSATQKDGQGSSSEQNCPSGGHNK